MSPWRAALLGGLAYGLAFALWLLPGLEPGSRVPDLAPAYRALIWSQVLAAALLLPATAAGERIWSALLPPLLLVTVPWPLVSLISLAGGAPIADLAPGQAAVALWALVLAGLWHLAGKRLRRPDPARALLQGTALLLPLFGLARLLEALVP